MIYAGETTCTARPGCSRLAYYGPTSTPSCGFCSQEARKAGTRTRLPENPRKKDIQNQENIDRFTAAVEAGNANPRPGDVIVSPLRFRTRPDYVPGYLPIFPNYLHSSRQDGLGLSTLSPKAIGPIDHGQPGLPPSLTLENLHQGNKVFAPEVDSDGNPTADFYRNRIALYQDPVPHRHKFGDKDTHKRITGQTNAPLYSIWVTPSGEERRYSYVESRQFYSRIYASIVPTLPEFRILTDLLQSGISLQIFGYDGYPVTGPIRQHYLDPSLPFGHELVLYTLLTTDPADYPWPPTAT